MEYLMTYGWAILIIAVVLGALFSLGLFNSNVALGTSCLAYSGYSCQNPTLHMGTFTATLNKVSGSSWLSTNIIIVLSAAGTPSVSSFSVAACLPMSVGTLNDGQGFSFSTVNAITGSSGTTCFTLPNTVGTSVNGAIWAEYTVGSTTGVISKLATLNVKAT